MKRLFLKSQLPMLVSVEAGDAIRKVTFCRHPEGFACEIKGKPSAQIVKDIFAFFDCYLEKQTCTIPTLDWEGTTPFTQEVLEALATIPMGSVTTYGHLAREVGLARGARAIGGACGRNPFPFFLPCHRVLSGQGLGGFSAGLEFKKMLLKFEGLSPHYFNQ